MAGTSAAGGALTQAATWFSPDTSPPGEDQLALRRRNLSTVLRQLRQHGSRSRAGIALDTGLNKATISSLIGELINRGLVQEGGLAKGQVGRPGQRLQLGGTTVAGVGVEINTGHVAVQAVDLSGNVRHQRRIPCDVSRLRPDQALDLVAQLVAESVLVVQTAGATPLGVTVAVPALVDSTLGTVSLAAHLDWHNLPAATMLAERLDRPTYPILVENDAHLAALAEYIVGSAAGSPNLLLLTGDGGLGAGIVADGRLMRGAVGYAGQVSHLPLDPQGPPCRCGQRGCWETLVGVPALLHMAADPDDEVRNPNRDLVDRLTELTHRAENGDARTLSALQHVGRWLGIGAAAIVNVLNPEVLVLGGSFAVLGGWLLDPMTRELAPRAADNQESHRCRVELSTLGLTAAACGGAQLVLESVITDPMLVPVRSSSPAVAVGDSA
jgi:predicted NBD/HSP70 family sugar kinase